ncbi:MAG: hypothetical protein RLY93_21000 [Sumerlaeia bacterium]
MNTRLLSSLIGVALLLCVGVLPRTALAQDGPQPFALMPAESNMIVRVDLAGLLEMKVVQQVAASMGISDSGGIRQALLNKLTADPETEEPELLQFLIGQVQVLEVGDLRTLTTVQEDADDESMVIVQGRYDAQKFAALLKQYNYEVSSKHHGVSIFRSQPNEYGTISYTTMLNNYSIAGSESEAAIKQLIDQAKSPDAKSIPEAQTRVTQFLFGAKNPIFFAARISPEERTEMAKEMAAMAQQLGQANFDPQLMAELHAFSIVVKEDATNLNLSMYGDFGSPEAAAKVLQQAQTSLKTQLAQLEQMLAQVGNSPQGAQFQMMYSIMKGIDLQAKGSLVMVNLPVPQMVLSMAAPMLLSAFQNNQQQPAGNY